MKAIKFNIAPTNIKNTQITFCFNNCFSTSFNTLSSCFLITNFPFNLIKTLIEFKNPRSCSINPTTNNQKLISKFYDHPTGIISDDRK